ncbi:hypothetical protein DFP72DRAFT_854183 [Ephemerocybe angulata]|uniref:CxC2-like cysteine cluster KDZ transposase-associated domain-containing protein n=1 Tax=Ephemerocybe angulata TaxID=980116 RepID=A0A8H6HJQ7_9AGAR|nr:hypothetical protein DFP72DRAFT_854183 [Tulosesus angulatus]
MWLSFLALFLPLDSLLDRPWYTLQQPTVQCYWLQGLVKAGKRLLHKHRPFDRSEVWTGTHFAQAMFKPLGLRIQLGHIGDVTCPCPMTVYDDSFVVIHSNGVHEISVSISAAVLEPPTMSPNYSVLVSSQPRWTSRRQRLPLLFSTRSPGIIRAKNMRAFFGKLIYQDARWQSNLNPSLRHNELLGVIVRGWSEFQRHCEYPSIVGIPLTASSLRHHLGCPTNTLANESLDYLWRAGCGAGGSGHAQWKALMNSANLMTVILTG